MPLAGWFTFLNLDFNIIFFLSFLKYYCWSLLYLPTAFRLINWIVHFELSSWISFVLGLLLQKFKYLLHFEKESKRLTKFIEIINHYIFYLCFHFPHFCIALRHSKLISFLLNFCFHKIIFLVRLSVFLGDLIFSIDISKHSFDFIKAFFLF